MPSGQPQSMPSGTHPPSSSLRLPSTLDGSIRRSCHPLTTTSPRVLTNSAYIKSGASLLDELFSSLSTCPSDYYVLVHQPGVHSTDFSTRKSAPRLGAKMLGKDKSIRSKMSVNEVAGLLETKDIQSLLEKKCKAQTTVIDGSCELPWWPLLDAADANPEFQLTLYKPENILPTSSRALASSMSSSRCSHWVRIAPSSSPTMVRKSRLDTLVSPNHLRWPPCRYH